MLVYRGLGDEAPLEASVGGFLLEGAPLERVPLRLWGESVERWG